MSCPPSFGLCPSMLCFSFRSELSPIRAGICRVALGKDLGSARTLGRNLGRREDEELRLGASQTGRRCRIFGVDGRGSPSAFEVCRTARRQRTCARGQRARRKELSELCVLLPTLRSNAYTCLPDLKLNTPRYGYGGVIRLNSRCV